MTQNAQTIAAIATAPGSGGIAIVRISGPDAHAILHACFRSTSGTELVPWRMHYGRVVGESGDTIDEAMAVRMRAPNTYTREDMAEIHCHGGGVQARRVLNRVLTLGARTAAPGAFTYRAFVGGRIDLSEAEAVMALVGSGSEASARAAIRQLDGGVSREIYAWTGRLTELVALIEASDDFPEEVEEQATAQEVLSGIQEVHHALSLASDARRARVLREGLTVVLVGRPNTGKSSLLNALLNSERAIVTEHAGTTRDLIRENAMIDGCHIILSDTAGQREARDEVERIGVDRARRAEETADLALLVLDGSSAFTREDEALIARADARYIAVINKSDLVQKIDVARVNGMEKISVSAKTGAGIDVLKREIASRAMGCDAMDGQLTIERHLDCARMALDALARAEHAITEGAPLDLAAIDLGCALNALYEITGECASEQVIERVFANFCVGK